MKTANEFKELRDKKYDDWINFDKKVKGQWQLLETIIDRGFNSLGHSQKYIDITNVGELYKENEKKLISEPNCFYITKDKNGTRLYFDSKDYNDYVNSNKNSIKDVKEQSNELKSKIENCNDRYKEALKKLNDDIYSSKETNLKDNEEKDDRIKALERLGINVADNEGNFKSLSEILNNLNEIFYI